MLRVLTVDDIIQSVPKKATIIVFDLKPFLVFGHILTIFDILLKHPNASKVSKRVQKRPKLSRYVQNTKKGPKSKNFIVAFFGHPVDDQGHTL